MNFELQFPADQLASWAEKYTYGSASENAEVAETGAKMSEQGHLTLEQLTDLCAWKTPRSKPAVQQNREAYVREVTGACLSSDIERFRIEVLTLLQGVGWPTASVILHFGHEDRYPIIDFRSLWSLGVKEPSTYSFDNWWPYVKLCRRLSRDTGLTMRQLDQALWQYSKEHQVE